jgi:predicted nucleic acid-binding Zn ribbon protein
MEARGTPRTVHVVLPQTHRSLCGYEEEVVAGAEGGAAVACPECSALLRSGLLSRRAASRGDR